MRLSRVLRPVALILAVALIAVVLPSPGVRATGASPRWTAGDYWEFIHDDNETTTRVEVKAKEATTVDPNTFHFTEATTIGSLTITTDRWYREVDFGEAKRSLSIFILIVTVYDPPLARAMFPLSVGKSWYGNSSYTVEEPGGGSGTEPFSGYVEAETDVTVPAGRFHVFVIRVPASTLSSHTKLYYTDSVGYWVKEESYNANGDLTGSRSLTRYNYQSQFWFTVLLVVIVAVVAIAIIAFLMKRRRQSVGKPGGPQGPQQGPPQMPVAPPPGTR